MNEFRRIGSFAKLVTRKNRNNNSSADVYSVTKYDGFVRSLDYFNKQVFSRDLSTYKIVKKGEFAYSTIHLDEGSIALFKEDEALISPMYTVFKVDESVDNVYLDCLLSSDLLLNKYGLIGQGSINRRKTVPFSSFSELEVRVPSIYEQKKIAKILLGIDTEKELFIKKKKLIHLAKISTIYKYINNLNNKNSSESSCKDVCKKIFVGIACSTTHAYTNSNGIPMLRNQNIKDGFIDTSDILYINKSFADKQITRKLQTGDVITARTGYPGISAVVPQKLNGCHSFTTLISRINQELVLPEYYSIYLNSLEGKRQIKKIQAGGAQENLNVSSLEKITIKIPDFDEQNKLIKISSTFDSLLNSIEKKILKLINLKTATSNDLLLGRKSVNV
tara:strand:- start:381 stop:1550 length:1170 start_codon:yes stop_codon:yes gene_type:complete